MSASTTTIAVGHATEHHGAVHLSPARRVHLNRAGLWLFFFSECFMFGGLLSARFYLDGTNRPAELNQLLGLFITSILLVSSVTAFQSEIAIKRDQVGACLAWMALTMLLGALFALGVAYEWKTAEWSVSEAYGTAFFSMTGMHALHVISGLGLFALAFRKTRRGHFSASSAWGIEGVVKYWHFVDVVWVFFYPALYLISW